MKQRHRPSRLDKSDQGRASVSVARSSSLQKKYMVVQCNIYYSGTDPISGNLMLRSARRGADNAIADNFVRLIRDKKDVMIIGMQEIASQFVVGIVDKLDYVTGYQWDHHSAETGKVHNNNGGVAIFWRKGVIAASQLSTINLGTDSNYQYRAVAGVFRLREGGKRFIFATCKLSFDDADARLRETVKLLSGVHALVRKTGVTCVIIALDMNSEPKSRPYKCFVKYDYYDGGMQAPSGAGPLDTVSWPNRRIDYLWYLGRRGFGEWTNVSGYYGSDHHFLWARVKI